MTDAEALEYAELYPLWSGYVDYAGVSNGQGTILAYTPSQLVGIYFEGVN